MDKNLKTIKNRPGIPPVEEIQKRGWTGLNLNQSSTTSNQTATKIKIQQSKRSNYYV
ncbi:hypothetical protein LX73_2472 [Fodinibius salinus]|uniref:Uncharacterized protein n=1 Tax=Fodinibius salinus TaxID=860790 RepID=A0A5D3YGG6_9BACT|nr:hypothetical protein LX73_2472 [Fodinibius salinus]